MRTLYLIMGPSGTGKSTLEKNIKQEFDWLKSVESYTTRQPRYDGEPGHRFVDKQTFDKLKLVAYTNYNGNEYGITAELLDDADLYVIDLDGIKTLKQRYDRPMVVVGLTADDSTVIDRMRKRGDSDANIKARLANDSKMFNGYLDACDVVIDANGDENSVLAQFIDKVIAFELHKRN